jgi:hypothetical protein
MHLSIFNELFLYDPKAVAQIESINLGGGNGFNGGSTLMTGDSSRVSSASSY